MPAPDRSRLLAQSLLVGTSGHRKLRADEIPGLQACVRAFLADLHARHPHLPVSVLSSPAEGSDQLVAQVALDLGLRVIAPLPLSLYRDEFAPEALAWLDYTLPKVDLLTPPLIEGNTPATVAEHGLARDRQCAQAGIFVSDHGHVLLALWDGCLQTSSAGPRRWWLSTCTACCAVPPTVSRRQRPCSARTRKTSSTTCLPRARARLRRPILADAGSARMARCRQTRRCRRDSRACSRARQDSTMTCASTPTRSPPPAATRHPRPRNARSGGRSTPPTGSPASTRSAWLACCWAPTSSWR